jgi:hypothetical protein
MSKIGFYSLGILTFYFLTENEILLVKNRCF